MIILIILCLFFHSLSCSEYYCEKDAASGIQNDVKSYMNEAGSPEYKFDFEWKVKCKEDQVIVRRVKISRTIYESSKEPTRSLSVLTGKELEVFTKDGGFCHVKYDGSENIEVEYSGRGDLTEEYVLRMCNYRQVKCGNEVYSFADKRNVWCRFNLKERNWTAFFMDHKTPQFLLYDDRLVCDMKENTRENHNVLCLEENCSFEGKDPLNENRLHDVCREDAKMKMRIYSHTQTASVWGKEAFKHYIRNYILTFIFYCYFMLQARRSPMARMQVVIAWKKFMSGINPKDEEESTLLDGMKKRERFLYERYKREKKREVKIEHLQEELKEAKDSIVRQAELVREEEEGESASHRPSNVSAGSRILNTRPCSPSELHALIQWSWMVESFMIASMNDDDKNGEMVKVYGMETEKKLEKMLK